MRQHSLIKAFYASLLLFAAMLSGCGSTAPPARIELTGNTMGTSYKILLTKLPAGTSGEQVQTDVDALLETINDQMSTWREDSEISRFNRYEKTDWFEVSAATAQVVAAANEISELSNGAFDITLSPLIDLWGFGATENENRIPTDEQLAAANRLVGFSKLEIRHSPPALKKSVGPMQVNLSAIAKGYGVDRIAESLDALNISDYMVELGGEVRTRGTRGDGTPWTIGIEAPIDQQRGELHRTMKLSEKAMATSGDYRNYFEQDGRRYSHTIDPRTSRPITHRLASVSVIADDCMTADARATALMVLGPEAGYNLAKAEGWTILMIVREQDKFVDKTTPRFDQLDSQ